MVRVLSDSLGLTVFIVTHDLDTLLSIIDRVIVLSKGKVIADGRVDAVRQLDDPWIKEYFSARAPAAQETS
jgi:phospholipid/cholesterol/gamma-HCH transport system ATP-binding protein